MLSRKTLGVAGAAILGTVALLGTNAAHAAINLDTDTGGIVFAKETLLTTETVDGMGDNEGNVYYKVETNVANAFDVVTKSKIGWTAGSSVRVKYTLTGVVFVSPLVGKDLEGVGTSGATKLGGGAKGESTVTFGVGIDAVSSDTDVTLNLGKAIGLSVDDSGMGSGSVEVMIENVTFDVSHEADYTGAIKAAPALKETRVANTVTAEVSKGFKQFSGADSSDTTATIGSFTVGLDKSTVKQADGKVVSKFTDVMTTASTDNDITFGGDFSFVKMAYLHSTSCDAEKNRVSLTLEKDDDDNVTGAGGIMVNQLVPQSDANTAKNYLCVTVGGGEDDLPINSTTYTITTMYDGIIGAKFGPTGDTYELGSIKRNGTTVNIPYLTSYMGYNNRLVLVNRGVPTPYSITFTTEDGVMAMPGKDASGTLASGTTVMSLRPDMDGNNDLVMLDGGSRTAATFTAEAPPGTIGVATTIVNLESRGTDTVVYQEAD